MKQQVGDIEVRKVQRSLISNFQRKLNLAGASGSSVDEAEA
jgi:hypothetical protein